MTIGRMGEEIATQFLIDNGWKILDRNYRLKFGEIDIVAKDCDKTLVFVEVKSLKGISRFKNNNTFKPEDHFDYRKRRKLKTLSLFYANNHPELIDPNRGWRIDLIALTIYENNCIINHYKNM